MFPMVWIFTELSAILTESLVAFLDLFLLVNAGAMPQMGSFQILAYSLLTIIFPSNSTLCKFCI
jgi:hypothetical protein